MSSNNRVDRDDERSNDRERRDDHADRENRDDHSHVGHDGRDHVAPEDPDEHDHVDREDRDDRDHVDHEDRDDHENYGPNPREQGKSISALIAVLGLWMVAQAFLFDLVASQFWNDVLVGALLLGVGGYNYSQRADERFGNTAAALIAVAVGVWLIAAPFVLGAEGGFTETTNPLGFYNDVLVGLLAIGLGAYSAYKARDHEEETRQTAT